ncbi:DUF2726 domain-containing protein [Burkholderia pseudomallei]|uniref:DUF2726 domain-containing protein n=1 Tax=Burkholderia pseudomallei TaxID=28450 RepID=UPI000F058939|nr:DUF2726 domain-containing protein [Burkholderia pseudomallei]CAJ3552734.1 Protein of uncharacterised function (DUF2726) [Burkholderia pseudomallei]CAJ5967276.1 Protein of uncharacterised function (DUF2726) [Burkholderia pseudomallei]CAJ7416318.1 Protein of uncharacterised function (DUF2726) [Burkholderia pseudomallei]CAJ9260810.1 Protein of uncharacterised function (DUF2726) [Burkholderia pseudomallei]VBL26266.1 Protein of uncharacterised function (DUF2726) [Burkholderia pseudomallei]
MSKRSKKKLQATTAVTAVANAIAVNSDALPSPQVRLAEMQESARMHIDNKAWDEILALGRVPLTAIHEDDRKLAEVWLLRVKILGLYPPGIRSPYELAREVREEYESALKQLAACVDAPHTLQPEFDLYIDTLGWSIDGCAEAVRHLSRACMERANVDWIRKLRARALRLLRALEWSDLEISAAEQQTLASLPDIYLVLSEAYAVAEQDDALDEEGRALVKVLRHDLDLRMADPWDYARVGEALLLLPCPTESELMALDESIAGAQLRLSPRAWAFMWTLEHASADDFGGLLRRFPEPLASDSCEGLRHVLCALVATPNDVDKYFSLAVRLLMRFADEGAPWFGDRLTMTLGGEIREIYVGQQGLHIASVGDMLLRLFEHSSHEFSRRNELQSLYRIFVASTQLSPLEDEDHGDQDMPGLAWLCEQSIPFQFAAAYVIQGVAGRMRLLLDAMRRTTEAGVPPPRNFYPGDFCDEDLGEPEAGPVLNALERLALVRSQMDEKTQRVWLEVAGDIFHALSKLGDKVRVQLLPMARLFSTDLVQTGHAFRLAYLEQVVGDADDALHYYLIDLDTSKDAPEVGLKNAKLLWARSDNLGQVQGFVDMLEAEVTTSSRANLVQQLLTDAKARLAALNKQDQFERTAVSRWPSLTAPARKLLSVFASIKSYNGLAEVAMYAGMDLTWAERHYDKLVELGMLFVTDKTFRVNSHIAPLLERESQHTVIGRIVRSQGTSAVKQVFNSQREFTIYQMLVQLCPNHLVFPNCSLQSVMSYERMKELVSEDDFGYYLRASVDIVVVSSTTYLPMLAIEVDSVWHDTDRQQRNDEKKDRLFASAGIPFMRLRPVGSPSENTIRAQVAEHVDELVRSLRTDLPGYDQARGLLEDLSGVRT